MWKIKKKKKKKKDKTKQDAKKEAFLLTSPEDYFKINVFLKKKLKYSFFYEILETGYVCTSVTSSRFKKNYVSAQKSIQIPSQTKGNSKWSTGDESAIDCHVSKQGSILFTLL